MLMMLLTKSRAHRKRRDEWIWPGMVVVRWERDGQGISLSIGHVDSRIIEPFFSTSPSSLLIPKWHWAMSRCLPPPTLWICSKIQGTENVLLGSKAARYKIVGLLVYLWKCCNESFFGKWIYYFIRPTITEPRRSTSQCRQELHHEFLVLWVLDGSFAGPLLG